MSFKTYSVQGILCVLALGATLQGFETSSMAVFIGADAYLEYFDNPGPILQGIISGSNPVGAFIGCWISGIVSDHFGRLFSMRLATIFWVTGSVISIFVQDIPMLVIGRVIKGITVGIFSSLLPVYVAEVIPDKRRGLATSVLQWCLTWGIMIMFYVSYFCAFITNDSSFRIAWGIELIPGSLLLLFSFLLPESPKWLASKAHWKKASQVMKSLNSKVNPNTQTIEKSSDNNDSSTPENLTEIEIVLNNFEKKAEKCTYLDLFRPRLRPHLLVGIATQIFTQLSGISVLMYYLVFICEMIGLSGEVKVLSASIQYVVNVLFTIFPIVLIDKLRRRDVLVYGAVCLAICIGSVGVIMGYYGHSVPPIGGNESVVWEVTGTPGTVCLALCFLFVAIFASTLSCAAWLYTNEIFPARAKAKGSAICMSFSWTFNFLLTFLTPVSLKYLKWATFCVFGLFSLVGAIIMIVWFPETYELNDHEINNLFSSQVKDDEDYILDVEEDKHEDGSSTNSRTRRISADDPSDSENIKLTNRTHLTHPESELVFHNSSPQASHRNLTPLKRNISNRTLLYGSSHNSPFFKQQPAIESQQADDLHYYNMSSNDSPFLKNYSSPTTGGSDPR